VALRARDLVAETGLTAFVKLSRSGAGLDVLIPVGEASSETAHMLGALFARLLGTFADSVASKIALLDAPLAPYAVVAPLRPEARATASVPLAWADVEAGTALTEPPSLERVAQGVARGAPDPMRAMLGLPVDFAYAVRAIEQVIAAGGWAGG
jgi:DNA primase